MNADPVVKGVLLLLLAASVWSWAVIIDKLWRLGAASRAAREHEARAAAARSPQELSATEGRGPAGLVITRGAAEGAGGRGAGPGRPSSYRRGSQRARPSRGRNPRRRANVASVSSAPCGWPSTPSCGAS